MSCDRESGWGAGSRLERAPNGADRDFVGIDDDLVAIGPDSWSRSRLVATHHDPRSRLIATHRQPPPPPPQSGASRDHRMARRASRRVSLIRPALHRPGPIVVFTVVPSICRPESRKGRPSQTYRFSKIQGSAALEASAALWRRRTTGSSEKR